MPTHSPPIPAHAATTMSIAAVPAGGTCLGRTCLSWRADGELIEDDRDLVLQRLRQVDPEAAQDLAA